MTPRWIGLLLAGGLYASACDEDEAKTAVESSDPVEPSVPDKVFERGTYDLLEHLDECDIRHRGLLLDVGSDSAHLRRAFAVGPFDDVVARERAGSTVGRVLAKRVVYDFWLLEEQPQLSVSFRARGFAAKRASVYLDDGRIGGVRLSHDKDKVHTLKVPGERSKGRHELMLRFTGVPKTSEEAYAEVDWIRLGGSEEAPERYAAPTMKNLLADVALAGSPRRSIVLKAPGSVQCALRIVPGATLRGWVGYWGRGEGVAQVRLLVDGDEPVVIDERPVNGGQGAAWTRLSLDLDAFASRVVRLELKSVRASGVGRVAFGEPEVVTAERPMAHAPAAKVVVLVVAAGLDRSLVPPWGPVSGLTALASLVKDGVSFDHYRVPTTVVGGVMATLITGLPPRAHTVEDPLARLPREVRTLGERIKEMSGRAAMYTGVPMSFGAFGFDRGWNRFEAFSPVKDIGAAEPIQRAAMWLKAQIEEDPDATHFVLIHARGGHPPWDLTQDEARSLPPQEYTGVLEPRRGAITLAGVRTRRRGRVLPSEDWTRLRAMQKAAMVRQDRELGDLLEMVDRLGYGDRTLVVFMGDVGAGSAPRIPFAPASVPSEDRLVVPLVVRFPNRAFARSRAKGLVTTADVTRTIVAALGLEAEGIGGTDLYRTVAGYEPPDGRPHTATLGNEYATIWGNWLLRGQLRRSPALCNLEVDPACTEDALPEHPIAASGLWRKTFVAEARARAARPGVERKSADLDSDTQAAMKVFGY